MVNLKNLKIELPKRWRESFRSGSENQFFIWLNHISTLANMNPKAFQDQALPSSSDKIVITKIGIPRFGPPPLKGFYEMMKALLSVGYLPGWTSQKLDELWKGITKTPGFERPGESDLSADISVTRHQTEEIAKQQFKNMALMPTKGFNVPVPGGVQIPGAPKNMTFTELLESDIYEKYMPEHLEKMKKYMPKEQLKKTEEQMKKLKSYMSKKRLEKMRSAIKEVQKEMPKAKQDFLKSGVKFKEGKYLGYQVIYMEGKNPSPRPGSKSSLSSKKTGGGTGMGTGGGGYYRVLDPLPKISQPYQKTIISYQAILVKNFIILGSLLWTIAALPSGSTPCYSLTRTKTKIHFTREDGTKYEYRDIVPVVSNIAKEGYFYREEVEEIIKKIISKLVRK